MDGSCSLSTISPADCAWALVFHWISCIGVPDSITSDHGLQFTSNLWADLCYMLNISHPRPPLTILKRMVQSKDCIASLRMRFMPALPQLLGSRRSLGSSSDSVPSQGNPPVFPQLRQFLAPPGFPNEFLQAEEFPLNKFLKFFQNPRCPCFFSAQQAQLGPPAARGASWRSHLRPTPSRSGCTLPASFHPCSGPTTTPTPSCAVAPRSFTFQAGVRDEIISISQLKPCTDADAEPGSPWRRSRPPSAGTVAKLVCCAPSMHPPQGLHIDSVLKRCSGYVTCCSSYESILYPPFYILT